MDKQKNMGVRFAPNLLTKGTPRNTPLADSIEQGERFSQEKGGINYYRSGSLLVIVGMAIWWNCWSW